MTPFGIKEPCLEPPKGSQPNTTPQRDRERRYQRGEKEELKEEKEELKEEDGEEKREKVEEFLLFFGCLYACQDSSPSNVLPVEMEGTGHQTTRFRRSRKRFR